MEKARFIRKLLKKYHLEYIFYWSLYYKILQINPIDPAVKPIIRKKENSAKSLGKELTISFS